jgi:tyrosyl-tRNA synthetase
MVCRFHGASAADEVLDWWNAGRSPVDVEVIEVEVAPLYQLLREVGAAKSGADARRKVQQGGVRVDGEHIDDPAVLLEPGSYLLQVGKKWAAQMLVRGG